MYSKTGYASVILPVDPKQTNVTAALAASSGAAAQPAVATVEPVEQPAPAEEPKASEPPAKAKPTTVAHTAPKATAKKEPAPKREPKTEKAEPAAAGGTGILMLASKPPCDIVVDGKSTGLTTPQRSISLKAGKHSVKLVNKEHGISESFSVTIKADESVRVIKDLTSKM
jgi:serine/threonine-protein kinase